MKYLVTDIGGTCTKYAGMDEECGFYEKGKIPTAKESVEEFLDMLTDLLEERLKVPVTIENDAKSAALAEMWRGSL